MDYPGRSRRQFVRASLPVLSLGLGSSFDSSARVPSRSTPPENTPPRGIADRVGVVHVDGKYHFSELDYLNEGAAVASRLGTNALKVWFRFVGEKYPYNSDWPRFSSLVELARHPYFLDLFDRPFETFVLVASSYVEGGYNHYFRDGFTDEQYEQEVREFYDLSSHLLRAYRGTGKEFVLQNWESDWALLGAFDRSRIASTAKLSRLARWVSARQEGIRRARTEIESDVTVLGAVEVNLVTDAMRGVPRAVNAVLPDAEFDLVSVSLWDVLEPLAYETDPNRIAKGVHTALEFVRSHAGGPTDYARGALGGLQHVYVGEIGWPLEKNGVTEAMRVVRAGTETALHWGARYVLYWQVYDNELAADADAVDESDRRVPVQGHYLVRPDGTAAPTWDYFAGLCRNEAFDDRPIDRPFESISLDFDRTVAEHSINEDVPPGASRELAIACSRVAFGAPDGSETAFEIGTPGREPILGQGVFEPERSRSTAWRWFGGPDGRASVYVDPPLVAGSEELRLETCAASGEIRVDVLVGEEVVDEVVVDDSEWMREVTVSIRT